MPDIFYEKYEKSCNFDQKAKNDQILGFGRRRPNQIFADQKFSKTTKHSGNDQIWPHWKWIFFHIGGTPIDSIDRKYRYRYSILILVSIFDTALNFEKVSISAIVSFSDNDIDIRYHFGYRTKPLQLTLNMSYLNTQNSFLKKHHDHRYWEEQRWW